MSTRSIDGASSRKRRITLTWRFSSGAGNGRTVQAIRVCNNTSRVPPAMILVAISVCVCSVGVPLFALVQPLLKAPVLSQSAAVSACGAVTSDSALRKRAITIVDPEYPRDAIKTDITGVVVSNVCVPLRSHKALFEVVFAPSESLRTAMVTALGQWQFKSPEEVLVGETPHSYGGKIIYYFVKQHSRFLVYDPLKSFYVGPHFAQ